MAVRDGYCAVTDLLLGDMPISSAIDPAKYIADSADEIDVRIGRIYVVPVAVNSLEPTAVMTLRIANARLASGRMILAQAQAAQSDSLNAYGWHLIKEAEATIASILDYTLPLEGAAVRSDLTDTPAPSIKNVDTESPVEAFYTGMMGGNILGLPSTPVWRPYE